MGKTTLFSRHTPGGVYSIYDEAQTTGNIFWVDSGSSTGGDTAGHGSNPDMPFLTLDFAIGQCTANNGDRIYLMPGHAETVATASAITADIAGVAIIGLGVGADKPTLTFSAVDATMVISAASVKLKGVIVKPSIDSVVSPIVVSGADCDLDYEHQDASATVECVSSLLTTAGADRLNLNLKYRGFLAGNACVAPIRLVGVDTARVYVDFYGVASTSVVEFHTTACHDIVIEGKFYNNGTTLTKNVVDTATGSTWHASGWDGNSNSNFSGGDNAALAADDSSAIAAAVAVIDEFHDVPAANNVLNAQINEVIGNKTDTAASGAVTGTDTLVAYIKQIVTELAVVDEFHDVPAADNQLNAQINEVIGNKTDAAAAGAVTTTDTLVGYIKQLVTDAIDKATRISAVVLKSTGDLTAFGTSKNLFTVTGDVLVRIGASVDVAVTSTSGTTTLGVGVAGNTACLCVQDAVDNSAFAIGDSWSLDTAADANGALLSSEYVLVGNGATIILTGSVNDITAGDIDFYCQYIPLSSDGAVAAAA